MPLYCDMPRMVATAHPVIFPSVKWHQTSIRIHPLPGKWSIARGLWQSLLKTRDDCLYDWSILICWRPLRRAFKIQPGRCLALYHRVQVFSELVAGQFSLSPWYRGREKPTNLYILGVSRSFLIVSNSAIPFYTHSPCTSLSLSWLEHTPSSTQHTPQSSTACGLTVHFHLVPSIEFQVDTSDWHINLPKTIYSEHLISEHPYFYFYF